MPVTVLLYSDRPEFDAPWRAAFQEAGLETRTSAPDTLAETHASAAAVVFDAGSEAYDEDELLASVGLTRALGMPSAVVLPHPDAASPVQDVLDELTGGLVARSAADSRRIAAALVRRADRSRSERFEYLTVSPRGGELLAVMGDAATVLLPRPVAEGDDGSEVAAIQLAEDARSAELELSHGKRVRIEAAGVGKRPPAINGNHTLDASMPGTDVDGVRLGARLRALRLAAGLTQAELARRTGIHRPNIARVEAGRHTPSLETLSRLAAAIGVPTTRVLAD